MSNDARVDNPINLLNRLIDTGYNRAFGGVLRAITSTTGGGIIGRRLDELDEEAIRLADAGEKLTADNPYVRALLADVRDELTRDAARLDGAGLDVQESGIAAANRAARDLALRGVSDDVLLQLGIQWNTPDPEAVNALVGYVTSDPWRDSVAKYGDDVYRVIENQVVRGMVEGWGPRRLADSLRQAVETLPAHQADVIARTLQLESYRTATAIAHRANAAIATGQKRIGTLDGRICLCCLALHGEEMQIGDKVQDHHQGRCTSVLIVVGYPEPEIITGTEWFRGLPEDRQLAIAGPGALEALQSGRASLRDFVQTYRDPVFGEMVRQGSIDNAIRNQRGRRGNIPLWTGERGIPIGSLDGIQTEAELIEWMGKNTNTAIGRQFSDPTMQLLTDEDWELKINRANVRSAAGQFVLESQNIQYGRDYLVDLMAQTAEREGVRVDDPIAFYNQQFAYQADAILTAARLGSVRLTEPQQRRLNQALNGGYLDMVYNTDSSVAGSLANQATRRTPQRLSGAELEQARANFRQWVQGQD